MNKGGYNCPNFRIVSKLFSVPSAHYPSKIYTLFNIGQVQFRQTLNPSYDTDPDFWTAISFQYDSNQTIPSDQVTKCPIR